MSLTPSGGRTPRQVLALADDLSGAAETAAALRLPARIILGPAASGPSTIPAATASPGAGRALIVDLDTRQRDADEAARIVREAVRGAGPGTVLLKKTDSLLRGNLAAETTAYAEGAAGLVIAPALPAAGRTVRDGIVHLRGQPLHDTDAWRAETRPAPRSVAAALDGTPTAVVPLTAVRAPLPELTARLGALVEAGLVPVCDTESDADLDAIAAAALGLGPGVRLMGTGGLAAALGRLGPGTDGPSPAPAPGGALPLLVVVGTAEPGAVAQIAQLTAAGARHIALPPELLARTAEPVPLTAGPDDAITVVSVEGSQGIRPGSARQVVAGLARTVAAVPYPADLVLTGGETARRVLDALGVTELLPVGEIHHGAVHSRTPDGRSVVTRPGSYGDAGSLLRIARALRPYQPLAPTGSPAQVPVPRAEFTAPHPPPPVSPVPQGEAL
ncbi:four-carbon acid sugar kinase family protein [Streptomyces sp. NPDC059396]|uniref:four-carbon acid sugar kinase family protein n=1 Tax=Streptomyces sp. NPDC059396 TaxID=3346819 RepID=UPI0036873C34